MSEPRTVSELIRLGERVLSDSTHIFEDHDNLSEAEELMEFCLDIESPDDDVVPTRRIRERYLSLVARRAGGEPFPLLVGRIEFYGLDLKVWPGEFIPRPSSELTVERAVKKLRGRKAPVVVDVCTGVGPIALAIAYDLERAEVWGSDISGRSLEHGRTNARRLGIENVRFRRGDMYGALPKRLQGTVDLITGHVPYVPPDEIDDLPAEVREYEPLHTLTDESDDGLNLMRHAVAGAPSWLRPGGWLLLEMSEDLTGKVTKMCKRAGLIDVAVASDDDDLSIVIEARKPR